jgi:hypothetical protein
LNKTPAIISKRTRPPTDNPIIKGKLDFGSSTGFVAHFFSELQYEDVQSVFPKHGRSLANVESPPELPPELSDIHLPDVHIKPPEHCAFELQGKAVAGLGSHFPVTDEHFNEEPHCESVVHDFEDPFLIFDIAVVQAAF